MGAGAFKKLEDLLGNARAVLNADREARGTGPPPSLPEKDDEDQCEWCQGAGHVRRPVVPGHVDFGKSFQCPQCNPVPAIAGVPPRFENATFDNFDLRQNPGMREAAELCRMVAARERWCALLIGDYGCGKTHLAVAAGVESAWDRPSVFWSVPRLLDWLRREAYGEEGERRDITTLLAPYERGKFLLILDDLGVEKRTEWADERLYEVLDGRYVHQAPTIITSNVHPERIDPRSWSRYHEGLVVCRGRDVRRGMDGK